MCSYCTGSSSGLDLIVYYRTNSFLLHRHSFHKPQFAESESSEAMAAYGALLSLSHTLHHVLHPPPLNKIIVDQQQIRLLLVKVNFFINFLDNYPPSQRNEEIESVERRIADAAHEAEDIVESNVVDQIHATRATQNIIESIDQLHITDGEKFSTLLCQGIQTILEKMSSIEKELPMMMAMQGAEGLQLKSCASTVTASSRMLPGGKKITMVGLDQQLEKIMSELGSDEPSRRVIPIVGMGGIGKTTLATAVYKHPYIVEYFHVRAWVTVSQEYTVGKLLLNLVQQTNEAAAPDKQESSYDYLGLQLHKSLFGRKYLVVMDDVWDMEAWEELKRFLPPNENGSRVMVTSRLSNLANDLGSCAPHKMDFLDEGCSWDLLREIIFGEEDCPVELEEIGKRIAKGCSGLPLALVLIGGVLAKSERIREQWEYFFAREMASALNSGNDEQVMKILSLSYIHLPLHLKPCFLYLAAFLEDYSPRASTLVKLWVAEGLIKPTQHKCLEEVAYEYVEDLVSRNVIMVDERGSRGKVKFCKLHDRVKEMCIIQAEKQEFVYILNLDNPNILPNIETARRLSISTTREPLEITIEALRSATLNRSWLCPYELLINGCWESSTDEMESSTGEEESSVHETESSATSEKDTDETESSSTSEKDNDESESSTSGTEASLADEEKVNQVTNIINSFRLLKVVHVYDDELRIELLNLCNLRYMVAQTINSFLPMTLCWNLQTIVLDGEEDYDLPVEIWKMPQLRYLHTWCASTLPEPPDDDQNVVVLENLHTLGNGHEFKCSEQVLKRIPNLKKLRIFFSAEDYSYEEVGNFCLQNLACFRKLESLGIDGNEKLSKSIAFPVSLKKLDLKDCWFPWEYLSIVVGSLPNLEVLKLYKDATEGDEWDPIEGKFCRLKFLMISRNKLKVWGAEKEHFPSLEHLVLRYVELEEIPMSFAEILTLETIKLDHVKESVQTSAREISEEREQLGYEPLILL